MGIDGKSFPAFGGMVISNAANGRANVKALVYGAVKLLPSH
jgi:hypothetical protein